MTRCQSSRSTSPVGAWNEFGYRADEDGLLELSLSPAARPLS